jgi:hypothetical protein
VRPARVWAKAPSASAQTDTDAKKIILIRMGKDLLGKSLGTQRFQRALGKKLTERK